MSSLPKPELKPQKALFWASLATFAAWLGVLTWVYVHQHSQ